MWLPSPDSIEPEIVSSYLKLEVLGGGIMGQAIIYLNFYMQFPSFQKHLFLTKLITDHFYSNEINV